jgi:hypothetical protein
VDLDVWILHGELVDDALLVEVRDIHILQPAIAEKADLA